MKPNSNEQYFVYGGNPMTQTCVLCGKPYSGNNTVPWNVGGGKYRDFPAHKKCENANTKEATK